MEYFVRVILLPVDDHLIAPPVRDERRERRRDWNQVSYDTGSRVRPNNRVPVALKVERPDDPVDELLPSGVAVRVNVDLPRQPSKGVVALRSDADVSVLLFCISWIVMLPTSRAIVSTPAAISGLWARLVYPLQAKVSKASGEHSHAALRF